MRRSLKIVGLGRFADREDGSNAQSPAAPSNRTTMRKNVSFHSMGIVKSSAKLRRHSWSGFSSKSSLRAPRSYGMIFANPRGYAGAAHAPLHSESESSEGTGVIFVPGFTRPRTTSTPVPAASSLQQRLQHLALGSPSASYSDGCLASKGGGGEGRRGSGIPSGARATGHDGTQGAGRIQNLKAAMQGNQTSSSVSGTLSQHRHGSGRSIFFIDYFEQQRALRLSGLYRRSADSAGPAQQASDVHAQQAYVEGAAYTPSVDAPPLLRRSYSSGAAEGEGWRAPGLGKRPLAALDSSGAAAQHSARDIAPLPVPLPLTPGGTPKLGGLPSGPLVGLTPLPPSAAIPGGTPAAQGAGGGTGRQPHTAGTAAAQLIRPAAVSWPWLDSSWGGSSGSSGGGGGGPGGGVASESSTLSSGSNSDSGGNDGVWAGGRGSQRPRSNTVGGGVGGGGSMKAGTSPSMTGSLTPRPPAPLIASLSLSALPVPEAGGEAGGNGRGAKRVRPSLVDTGGQS